MSIILVTGANKGIGLETATQLRALGHDVWIGSRDSARGARAAKDLGARHVVLDVTDDDSVAAAATAIQDASGQLDVLVNNAGVTDASFGPDGITGPETLRVFDTNAVGVIRVTQAMLPLLRRSDNPVVVNLSSALGSFWAVNNPDRRQYHRSLIPYGASKAAVSMITVLYANAVPEIKFNAVEPGFTDTDLTAGVGGGRSVQESAAGVVRMATISADGPTGTYREDDHELPW